MTTTRRYVDHVANMEPEGFPVGWYVLTDSVEPKQGTETYGAIEAGPFPTRNAAAGAILYHHIRGTWPQAGATV